MPQLIQRNARGLLSLFDSKAGGIAPNILLDEVRATVDITKSLGLGVRTRGNASTAAAGVVLGPNFNGVATVPFNEVWHVLNITGIVNNVIAAGITWAPGHGLNAANRFCAVVPEIATATGVRGITGAEVDIWLGPGEAIGTYVTRTAAGADLLWEWTYDKFSL